MTKQLINKNITSKNAKLTSKGQITIPIAIRSLLKAEEGDNIQFVVESNRIYIQKVLNECPVCLGEKAYMEQPCFYCLEWGEISETNQLTDYQPLWFEKYGVETTLTLESINGITTPRVNIQSENFTKEMLDAVHDNILLSYYNSRQVSAEQILKLFKTNRFKKILIKDSGDIDER